MKPFLRHIGSLLPRLHYRPIKTAFSAQQSALIKAMLTHVAFDGWTTAALAHAARSMDMPYEEARSYFPHARSSDYISLASLYLDNAMCQSLEQERAEAVTNKQRYGTTKIIQRALELRMELEEKNFHAAQRGFSYLMLPSNLVTGTRIAWQTCDRIWSLAGSDRNDPAYHSKRRVLFGVYLSTWLVWLNSEKPRREFCCLLLNRQLGRALRIGRMSGKFRGPPSFGALQKFVARTFNPEYRRFRSVRRGM